MGLFASLFGERNRSSPQVRGVQMALEPPEGEISQGQVARMKLKVKLPAGRTLRLEYLQFDLTNRREEKKAFLDKMVTSSRFIFRTNFERELAAGEAVELAVEFLPPVCREGSRKTKFVTIVWEIAPELVLSEAGRDATRATYRLVGPRQEVAIKGRR